MDRLNRNSNKETLNKAARKAGQAIAGVAVSLGLASTMSGCATHEAPKSSISATPSPSPEVTSPSPSASETASEIDQKLEAYWNLDAEDFYRLPRDKQLMLVWDQLEKMNNDLLHIDQFPEQFSDGSFLAEYNPVAKPVGENSVKPTEIFRSMLYMEKAMNAQVTEDGHLDPKYSAKMVAGSISCTIPEKRDHYFNFIVEEALNGNIKPQLEATGQILSDSDMTVSVVDKCTDETVNGVSIVAIGSGYTIRYTLIPVTFPDKNGVERTLWLQNAADEIKTK